MPFDHVPILMYHSIADGADPRFSRFVLTPADFRRQARWLADNGYRTLTLSSLVDTWRSGSSLPAKSVVLTFDDGFADFYTEAVPVLVEHGLTATLYAATGFIGKTSTWLTSAGEGSRPMLTWSRLREIGELGLEIGAHTHSHPQLDRCATATISQEIRGSKAELEDKLGAAVRSFAYPFGYWSKRVRDVTAEAGFDTAVQVGELTSRSEDDVLSIPRLSVNHGTSEADLARLLDTNPTSASRAVSASKRLIWQAMRNYVPGFSGDPVEGARTLHTAVKGGTD